MDKKELDLLVKEGEGLTVEFKEKFTPKIDQDMVAFANTKGGKILIGVSDESKIIGQKLTNPLKAQITDIARHCHPSIPVSIQGIGEIIVVTVQEGDEKPYSCSLGYYRRLDAVTQKMTQGEIKAVFRESIGASFESLPHKDFNLADISLKKIKAFLAESKTNFKVTKSNLESFLASVGTLEKGRINNAGVLMYAEEVGRFIPYSELICGAFKGKTKTYIYDRKDVRDDLLTQLNEAITFLQKHLNVRSEIRGINRYDIYELPLDALREAVVNAIIHRDYSMRGTSIYVGVYDDRVEIENPGGLPPGLQRKDFGKTSIRRNLIVADLFHRMGKVERVGSGIKRMRDLMGDAGLKAPKFEMTTFFRTIFYRDPRYALKRAVPEAGSQKSSLKGSQKSSQKILDLISQNSRITIEELAKALDITDRAVKKNIQKLKSQGILERIGPDKGGYWKLIASPS